MKLRYLTRKISPTMAVALLALFVALGGTAVASSRINSAQIQNRTIKLIDIQPEHDCQPAWAEWSSRRYWTARRL